MTSTKYLTRRKLFELLIESGLILFSVLLALFLNEHRSQLKENQLKDQAMQKVKIELKSNLEILNEWFPYHQKVLSSFDQALKDEASWSELSSEEGVRFWSLMPEGVVQRLVDDAAWQALRSSGVFSQIDLDTMMVLSTTYKLQQEGVESTIQSILETLYSREALDERALKETLILLRNGFQELVSQEDFLIHRYEATLELLEEPSP